MATLNGKEIFDMFPLGTVVEVDGRDNHDDYYVVIGTARGYDDYFRLVKLGGNKHKFLTRVHYTRMHKVDTKTWF